MSDKKAVLLVNLGSPDSTKVADVRRYLAEFLMDRYVIDVPYVLRLLIIYCFILPFRPKKSAEAYASIWWDEGSPLIILSKKLHTLVQQKCSLEVGLAMRYANPSIKFGIEQLLAKQPNLQELLLVPLYPHYAMASTLTVIEKTKTVIKKHFPQLTLSYIESFYNDPRYITALANSIKQHVDFDQFDKLLFSYHGIPERHVKKTDRTNSHCLKVENCCQTPCAEAQQFCYSHHVYETTRLVVEQLGLNNDQYLVAFQSRLGNDPWLTPATDQTIDQLAKDGVKRLAVVCPAFVSDCLETLEEIGEEAKESFLEHGGESFKLVPCLNDDPQWVDTLVELIEDTNMYTVSGTNDLVI